MSEDINVTDGTVLEALNNKVDLDGGNYIGSGLDKIIHDHCSSGLEIGDIGIAPLGIDETKGKRRYLNGQLIIQEQYVQFTDKVKSAVALYPSLACTESEWQTTATMTVGGQVGKFVVDDEAGTIRLPKIIMPIQGLTDLSKLAEIVEAGLPNIEGQLNVILGTTTQGQNGAFSTSLTGQNKNALGNGSYYSESTVNFNASLSNPIYGNSDTVQQEQIQYPYFIQVATGAETEDNIINEIELNNPYSFGDSKYSPVALNNLSWLKSEGQYNPKAVYTDYYEWLLKIYNGTETVEGVNVKLSTEEYTDYDFVLNTAEETFRLPLLDGSETMPDYNDYTQISSIGTYVADKNCYVVYFSGTTTSDGAGGALFVENVVLENLTTTNGTVNTCKSAFIKKGQSYTLGSTADFKSCKVFACKGNGSLYYYVGETVQNANLINAGRIEEKLADKLDRSSVKAYITESYVNGTSWYRVYSDGWCEQGYRTAQLQDKTVTWTFLKPFINTNYMLQATVTDSTSNYTTTKYRTRTTTNCSITSFGINQAGAGTLDCYACGYIA